MQTAHVLLEITANDNDNGTRAEEEQSLEHGMGEEMEHASHVTYATLALQRGTYAECYEHVGNLRNGREGQTTLNIGLRTSNCSCVESGKGCDISNIVERLRSISNPDGEQRSYLEHTGNHHRSSMYQRTNRRWTLHGIGQPDVKREHGRLTCTTDEHEEQRHGDDTGQNRIGCHGRQLGRNLWIYIQVVVKSSHIEA